MHEFITKQLVADRRTTIHEQANPYHVVRQPTTKGRRRNGALRRWKLRPRP
jgi:hypothetical protein